MKTLLRLASSTLLVFGIIALALTQTAAAGNPPQSVLPVSPLSGGALMAQMIHAGKLVPQTGSLSAPLLSCSPTPCKLTEVNASSRSQPANETPIVVDPNNANNILTGANDYSCGSLQGFYASTDAGTTWMRSCAQTLSGYSGGGDPNVGYGLNGDAYRVTLDIGSVDWVIAFSKSTDHGLTWSAPVLAAKPIFSGGITDKEWTSVDVTNSPYKSTIYTSITQFDSSQYTGAISVAHSSDGGATWKNVQASEHSTGNTVIQSSDLAIAKDGTVYVSWQECPANPTCSGQPATFKIAKSTDQGNTWTSPMTLANVNLAAGSACFYGCLPNTSERVFNIPVIDVDNSGGAHNGRIYAVFYNWVNNAMQLQGTYSDNGGSTWSIPAALSKQTKDQFFPWISVNKLGQVGVSWLDRRDDPSNLKYMAYGAVYIPGVGLKGDKAISGQQSNPLNDGFGGGFMGDYDTNYWTPDGKTLYYSYCATYTGTCQDWVTGFELK